MAIAYIDETGHPDDPQRTTFGLAGFIGKEEAWSDLDRKWRAVCPEDVLPFHMKDFAQRKKKFRGWGEANRRQLLGGLVTAIKQSDLVPVAVVVCLHCYRALSEERKESIRNIYGFALSHLLAQVSGTHIAATEFSIFDSRPPALEVVFADSQIGTRTHDEWWRVKTNEEEGVLAASLSSLLISSVSLGTPDTCTPLQAADLRAYEVGHHFEYILPNKREPRFAFREIHTLTPVNGVGTPSFAILHKEILESDQIVVI